MLNLFEKKTNTFTLFPNVPKSNFIYTERGVTTNKKNKSLVLNEKIGEIRHYPPANKEWINSVYSYDKTSTKLLPAADNTVNRLIKSYFNLSPVFDNKKSKRVQIRFKRLSLNRILVSKAEMKHTNHKVIITVYVYNKNKKFFIYKLKNLYKTFILKLPSMNNNTLKKLRKNSLENKPSKIQRSLVTKHKSQVRNLNFKNLTITRRNKLQRVLHTKKFSTKRFSAGYSSPRQYNYINYMNTTKKRLAKFLIRIKNTNLKNKYKTLIKKYYYIFSKYKFYNLSNNNNYYLNSNNIPLNSNDERLATSIFYITLKGKYGNYSFKTKRNNAYFKSTVYSNAKSSYGLNEIRPFKFTKPRSYRNVKGLMHKLISFSKLFSLNNLYDYKTEGTIISRLDKEGVLKNVYKILKNSLASKAKKRLNVVALKGIRLIKKARKHKSFLVRTLKWNNKIFARFEHICHGNFIKKAYKKEMLYLYYLRMLAINNSKFKNWFLSGLNEVISRVYRKKIEFNFVNLKYLPLNSDIFSESIAIKLRNRQNRLLAVLKKALKLVKIPTIKPISSVLVQEKKTYKNFINKYKTLNINSFSSASYNNNNNNNNNNDALHGLLHSIFVRNFMSPVYTQKLNNQSDKSLVQKNVLNSIRHRAVFGVRLEATGRLSKRLTASRSVFKLKYKGSLKNIDSIYKNLPSVILRGNIKPNIQYTKISSKTRNGSFGLKGWVSGY